MDGTKRERLLNELRTIESSIADVLKEVRSVDWTSTSTEMLRIDIEVELAYRGIKNAFQILRRGG